MFVTPQNSYAEPLTSKDDGIRRWVRLIFFKFIFGCVGSLSLHASFLQLRRVGATLRCSVRASHCGGFSCCRARALGTQASVVVAHGLSSCGARAQLLHGHVGSSRTRAQTRVPCIGRRILNHCATREAPINVLIKRCHRDPQPLLPCEDTARRHWLRTRRALKRA